MNTVHMTSGRLTLSNGDSISMGAGAMHFGTDVTTAASSAFVSSCTCGQSWHSITPPPACPVHSSGNLQPWNGPQNPPPAQPLFPSGGQVSGQIPMTPEQFELLKKALGAGEPQPTDEEIVEGLREMIEELGE